MNSNLGHLNARFLLYLRNVPPSSWCSDILTISGKISLRGWVGAASAGLVPAKAMWFSLAFELA
jgi:hypothetical protein